MSHRYPRIRVTHEDGFMYLREGLSLSLFLPLPHEVFASQMLMALERYASAVGPAFGAYIDADGERQTLDDAAWTLIRSQMLHPKGAGIHLADVDSREERYRFDYDGATDPHPFQADAVSAMRCWFPTEYLEEHGPAHLRALALEMLGTLPISAGNLGLSVRVMGFSENQPSVGELALRYPGFSINDIGDLEMYVGTRLPDISWVTFLGQPALGDVGGIPGLRARLRSPSTVVEELPGDRAVTTLGEWPDAGDVEQGRTLPGYRELAGALEPVLYREQREHWSWHYDSPEQLRQVERRFLDPGGARLIPSRRG